MQINPSQTLISAANAVFACKAAVETLRPQIEQIQRDLVDYLNITCDPKHIGTRREEEGPLDPNHVYLATKEAQAEYFELLDKWYRKAGYTEIEKGQCPLLIAQSVLIQAERLFIESTLELTAKVGFTPEMLETVASAGMANGLAKRQKYIDLNLTMMAPFVKRMYA